MIFDVTRYAFSSFAVPTLATATAIFLLGLIVVLKERASTISVRFVVLTTTAAIWLYGFSGMYCAIDEATALIWAKFAYIGIPLIAAAVYHFTVTLLGIQDRFRNVVRLCWAASIVFMVAGVATPWIFNSLYHYRWGFYPRYNWPAAIYLVYFCAVLLLSMIHYFRELRATASERARVRIRAFMIAFAFGYVGSVDYLASFGIPVFPFGFVGVLGFLLLAALSIRKHRLVELTASFAADHILDTMQGAVFVIDLANRIRVVNRAAAEMLGHTSEEIVGRALAEVVQDSLIAWPSGPGVTRDWSLRDESSVWTRKDSTQLDVSVSASAVYDLKGLVEGLVVVAIDVSDRSAFERALQRSEEEYRGLFENAHDAILIFDPETEIVLEVNERACVMYGFTRAEFVGMKLRTISKDPEKGKEKIAETLRGKHTLHTDSVQHRKDGSEMHLEINAAAVEYQGRQAVLSINRDVTGRKRAESALRTSEERYRNLFERNLAGVFRNGLDGRVLDCNDAYVHILGYSSKQELLESSALQAYMDPEDRFRLIDRLRTDKALANVEIRARRKDGKEIWLLENVNLVPECDGSPAFLEGTLFDITERKEAEELIRHQAYHDPLTDLPNRKLLTDRISQAISASVRDHHSLAVLFIDLDQFKNVNDTVGHGVGDRMLQSVGERLKEHLSADDVLSRVGGDEFVILLNRVAGTADAMKVAQKLLATIAQPFRVEEHEFFVTASIGVAIYPGDGRDAAGLIKNADSAMYRAKELGRNTFQLCTGTITEKAMDRMVLEMNLRQAVDRDELVLHYQPQFSSDTEEIVGVEALVRWLHPERGLISPLVFIPIAENSGLILQIGEWVLRTGCRQLKLWHDAGFHRLRLGVNISARQFQQPDLVELIASILRETQINPGNLELEITETTAMQNTERTILTLHQLKDMGIRISIDDFGTGHSSLNYLKRFPIDALKIDQSFVRDIMKSPSDAAIVTAVIAMARGLNLNVIAEGVETSDQLSFLRTQRCHELQGFLFSRPLLPATLEQFFRASQGARLFFHPARVMDH